MSFTRKSLLAASGAFAGVAFVRFPGDAAEFELKMGNDEALTHPIAIRAQQAIARIKQQTNGRVDIRFFPDSQLGGMVQMLAQVRSGAIDLLAIGDNILASVAPPVAISNIPFAFRSFADAYKALDGPLGAYIRGAIGGVGVYPFSKIWNNGYRDTTTSTTAVNTPDDLRGLKMRVPPAPLEQQLFKALGASPTAIDASAMYTALQTHIVEGTELPLGVVQSYKIYEVQKHLALTRHIWNGYWVLVNSDLWAKLPKDLHDVMESSFNAAGQDERRDIEQLEQSLVATLTDKGMAVTTPDATPFQAALRTAGAYDQWQRAFGNDAWALLESTTGKLG